jgi:hypothetical protein
MPLGFLSILFALVLAACAPLPPAPRPVEPEALACLDLYEGVDQAVARHGVEPSSPARIQGFPYLRVDRFLASYRNQLLEARARRTWLAKLADLDREARAVELDSLPKPILTALESRFASQGTLSDRLLSCSRLLQTYDLRNSARFQLISMRAVVPDDYHTLNRVLGLYPLTALPVSYGVFRWQEEAGRLFAVPLESLPIRGTLSRWRPPEGPATWPPLAALSRDALGIPVVDQARLAALFAAHAPVWEVDVAGDYDRPGSPHWREDGKPTVDAGGPAVYRYLSLTRWQGRVLLQLNYLIWFSERPYSGQFDLLAGALDGLIWRVTLDDDGRPLLYDSIHPCGCYHQFFPGSHLGLRRQALSEPEPPLVPQTAPLPGKGERIVVRLASGTHYIQRVYSAPPSGNVYAWHDYRGLYAVPITTGGARSLFGPDGLVPGTERAERWLLWPMGVPSPGAMRERGRQATAFLGRRHFDDPYLLERLFEPREARP